jgi:hypothetical protein
VNTNSKTAETGGDGDGRRGGDGDRQGPYRASLRGAVPSTDAASGTATVTGTRTATKTMPWTRAGGVGRRSSHTCMITPRSAQLSRARACRTGACTHAAATTVNAAITTHAPPPHSNTAKVPSLGAQTTHARTRDVGTNTVACLAARHRDDCTREAGTRQRAAARRRALQFIVAMQTV